MSLQDLRDIQKSLRENPVVGDAQGLKRWVSRLINFFTSRQLQFNEAVIRHLEAIEHRDLPPAAPAAPALAHMPIRESPRRDNGNSKLIDSLDDLPNLHALADAPAHLHLSERLMLYTLMHSLRPMRVLEIGTSHGGSAMIMTAALDDIQKHYDGMMSDARIITVDPEPQVAPETWDKIKHRVTQVVGYSPDALAKAQAVAGGKFDFVFIDGHHTVEATYADLDGVMQYLEPDTHIIVHDAHYWEVIEAHKQIMGDHADKLIDCGYISVPCSIQQFDETHVYWLGLYLFRYVGGAI